MSANDGQVGGAHYKDMAVQPWDAMRAWMSAEAFAGYLLGNVIKYAARHQAKGGVEDLRKARHYLDKLIETKEVMQTEPAHRPSGSNTVTAPAVSESAAGDADSPTIEQIAELRRELAARCAAPMLAPTRCGDASSCRYDSPRQAELAAEVLASNAEALKALAESEAEDRADAADWPGPDWSQAPVGCVGWVAQSPSRPRLYPALWLFGPGEFHPSGCWNTHHGYPVSMPAPLFDYPGGWRNSFRQRP